jgi:hypothetical protein
VEKKLPKSIDSDQKWCIIGCNGRDRRKQPRKKMKKGLDSDEKKSIIE